MINEELLGRLKHDIVEYGVDYSAEALAANLIRNGIAPEQLIFQLEGISKRSYRKEISDFHTEISEYDGKEYLFLHTHRDGIYDALPESIFHQQSRSVKTKLDAIEEIKRHREEEQEARKFFLPFEYELQAITTLLYSLEESYERHTNGSKLIDIFSRYWPVMKKFDSYHSYLFLRTLPIIHRIRNDFALCSTSLGLLLGVKVELGLYWGKEPLSTTSSFELGQGTLAKDTTIGMASNLGEYDLKLTIGPLKVEQVEAYMEGGPRAELIDELLDFYISAHYKVYKELIVEEAQCGFVLEGNTVLGMNAYLG